MKRDRIDRRRPERTLASFLASLLLHALGAYFLFSLATSSSEQAAPESFTSGAIVSVTRQTPQQPVPVQVATAQPPVPHAPVLPQPTSAAQPQAAPPHPRILHELSKFAPTAPPNPTPAPVSTMQPVPAVTQVPQISVTSAPILAAVPTSVPASVTAVSVKPPPTAAPIPKPTAVPTAAPTLAPPKPTTAPTVRPTPAPPKPTAAPTVAPSATPAPEPSALQATAAPIVAMAKPQVVVTPGAQSEVKVTASVQKGTAPTPGPKTVGSPGPRPVAPVKAPVSVARPIQPLPATPPPHAAVPVSKRASSLLQRLRNLIPTAAPSVAPAAPKHYSNIGNLKLVPPEPTPPPEVLAVTKYLYVENVAGQRWTKIIGSAPEERYVKMYVTKVKRIGFINWCTGWVVRAPMAGTSQWEVEPNASFICSGHLEPFSPDALPSASPSP